MKNNGSIEYITPTGGKADLNSLWKGFGGSPSPMCVTVKGTAAESFKDAVFETRGIATFIPHSSDDSGFPWLPTTKAVKEFVAKQVSQLVYSGLGRYNFSSDGVYIVVHSYPESEIPFSLCGNDCFFAIVARSLNYNGPILTGLTVSMNRSVQYTMCLGSLFAEGPNGITKGTMEIYKI